MNDGAAMWPVVPNSIAKLASRRIVSGPRMSNSYVLVTETALRQRVWECPVKSNASTRE